MVEGKEFKSDLEKLGVLLVGGFDSSPYSTKVSTDDFLKIVEAELENKKKVIVYHYDLPDEWVNMNQNVDKEGFYIYQSGGLVKTTVKGL